MKNLILIPNYRENTAEELHEIADLIRQRDCGVRPYVVSKKKARWLQLLWMFRPSLYVGLYVIHRWRPIRGRLLQCAKISKNDQYQPIQDAGLDALTWTRLRTDSNFSEEEWGPLVVLKPEGGKCGMDVKLCRTDRLVWNEKKHGDREWVVQKLVYTGAEPVSYRVMTLFGKMLYMEKSCNVGCGGRFENPEVAKGGSGHNIVASSRKGIATLEYDEVIATFAETVAREAFSEVAILGLDVMRDIRTGKLYVAEVNPNGMTWHFSTRGGKEKQATFGYSYAEQFGAYELAAKQLIAVTDEFAK